MGKSAKKNMKWRTGYFSKHVTSHEWQGYVKLFLKKANLPVIARWQNSKTKDALFFGKFRMWLMSADITKDSRILIKTGLYVSYLG